MANATATKPTINLTAPQSKLLRAIHASGDAGHVPDARQGKTIDALLAAKLVKAGARNKATGVVRYTATKGGAKFVAGMPTTATE